MHPQWRLAISQRGVARRAGQREESSPDSGQEQQEPRGGAARQRPRRLPGQTAAWRVRSGTRRCDFPAHRGAPGTLCLWHTVSRACLRAARGSVARQLSRSARQYPLQSVHPCAQRESVRPRPPGPVVRLSEVSGFRGAIREAAPDNSRCAAYIRTAQPALVPVVGPQ